MVVVMPKVLTHVTNTNTLWRSGEFVPTNTEPHRVQSKLPSTTREHAHNHHQEDLMSHTSPEESDQSLALLGTEPVTMTTATYMPQDTTNATSIPHNATT